ncbi:aspartyl/asparaginyl beta-hydroxylase domain-containing protein [Sandarakinorhabdus sp. DWP1-3-1]|uniref:aspartyl/asparaginyl beta-hydroxylase domain-containing protein n=1 Tax=Sandarakinorhabdus sp. DWP1-3-1 TaxID=2804627 RepID=UPI003CF203B4
MIDPDKARFEAIAHGGIDAFRRGDTATARQAFETVTASGRGSAQLWLVLAQCCDLQDDRPAARQALGRVLQLDPDNPYALCMQGEIYTRDGDDRAAVSWYERALASANGRTNLPADLVERLQRADAERTAAADRFLGAMQASLAAAGGDANAAGPRFAEALAIISGRSAPQLQQPTSFYFPGLPQQAFYDPADFAWTAGLMAATAAIKAEAMAMMADTGALQPYAEQPRDRPPRDNELFGDPRWSACHLMQGGIPTASAARCPATMAALDGLPIPVIKDHSPMVLFSILAPGMHIPPHHGMLNTRLICHLPLLVPPDCRLRVGNHTRDVREGEMLIFDDSIEHEAWNDSGAPRAILLFEIWRPELSPAERAALTVMFEAVTQYGEG